MLLSTEQLQMAIEALAAAGKPPLKVVPFESQTHQTLGEHFGEQTFFTDATACS